MVRPVLVLLLALALVAGARAQTPDTVVAVEGFLQQGEGSGWTLVVPSSVVAFHIRTYTLVLVGHDGRWDDLRNLYVAARGRMSRAGNASGPLLKLAVADVREATPPGTVIRTVDRGVGLRSRATLAVIPDRFAWDDAQGRSTGVNPLVLYTILNQRVGAVEVIRPTDLNFCVHVADPLGVGTWDTTFILERSDARRFEAQTGSLREGVQLPRIAARRPGHYTVLAGVCEAEALKLTAGFDVDR